MESYTAPIIAAIFIVAVLYSSVGHGGASGRYDHLREVAFKYAFLLDVVGGELGD